MKILQVGKFYYPFRGGMETYLFDLCEVLKKETELQVLVANTAPKTVREKVRGVDVIRAASLGRVAHTSICPSFPALIRRHAAEINTVHHPDPMAALSYLLARPRGKLTVVYHSDIVKQKLTYLVYYPILMKFLRRAGRISVTSPQYLESSVILSKFKNKCVVIPIGIDISLYRRTPEIAGRVKEIRREYGEKTVLFIGRLALYKGVEYLVKAMENVEGKLIVIGGGDRLPSLMMMVASHGLEDKIFFMENLDRQELLAYLHACSVFCLPSITRNEAFGIVGLEAMACGRPVVSTRLKSGIAYTNQDGLTGRVVPPADAGALAAALNEILADPERGEAFGRAGRKRVEELFSREKMAGSTLEMYRDLLGEGR